MVFTIYMTTDTAATATKFADSLVGLIDGMIEIRRTAGMDEAEIADSVRASLVEMMKAA